MKRHFTAIASLVFSTLWLIGLALYVVQNHYVFPYHDTLDFVTRILIPYHTDKLELKDFFKPHAGDHWHTTKYATLFFLAKTGMWSGLSEVLISTVFAALAVGCLFFSVLESVKHHHTKALAQGALCSIVFFVFSLDQASNWLWGWQMGLFMAIFGASIVITQLSKDNISIQNFSIAVLGCVLSVYSYSTGFCLLLIGLVMLTFNRKLSHSSPRLVIIWMAFSCLIILHAYFVSFLSESHLSLKPEELLLRLPHVFVYIGEAIYVTPTHNLKNIFSYIAFWIGLVAAIAWILCWQHTQQHLPKRLKRMLIGLALFSVFSAAMIGTIRDYSMPRYITFSGFFWISLTILMLLKLHYRRGVRSRIILKLALIVIVVLKIQSSYLEADSRHMFAQNINASALQLKETFPRIDEVTKHNLMIRNSRREKALDFLYKNKIGFFR